MESFWHSGSLSEWFNEAVLKTVELKGSTGSNPVASARRIKRKHEKIQKYETCCS